jgi:hypothetical protein
LHRKQNIKDMDKVKGVLLIVLIFAVIVPCLGNSLKIKRKKNKWLYVTALKKITDVCRDNQIKTDSFVY